MVIPPPPSLLLKRRSICRTRDTKLKTPRKGKTDLHGYPPSPLSSPSPPQEKRRSKRHHTRDTKTPRKGKLHLHVHGYPSLPPPLLLKRREDRNHVHLVHGYPSLLSLPSLPGEKIEKSHK